MRDLKSQDLSVRRSPPEMRRSISSLRKLREGNKGSTIGAPQLRWKVLTTVRDI